MAEGKKSFVLYSDIEEMLNELPDDVAGRLFKTIIAYVNDKNPVVEDVLLKVSFAPIKAQLKRDLVKYESKKTQYSDAGKASAEAKRLKKLAEEQQRSTNLTNVEERSTFSTVNVNVNDSVNVNVNDTVIKEKEEGDKSPPPKTIEEREESFRLSLTEFVEEFSKETVRAFFNYWSEKNPKGLKMRFEMEKTFEIKKRLTTWKNKESQFAPKNNSFGNDKPKQTTFDKLRDASEEARRIREERRAQSDSNGEEGDFAQYIPVD